jgi:hypothetical protein
LGQIEEKKSAGQKFVCIVKKKVLRRKTKPEDNIKD